MNVYNAFKDYYLSYDLRVLAYKHKLERDYEWRTIISSVFLSEKKVEDISSIQKSLKLPTMNNIQLFCFSDKSVNFKNYFNHISRGGIYRFIDIITNEEVAITIGKFDLGAIQIGYFPKYYELDLDHKLFGTELSTEIAERDECWALLKNIEDNVILIGYENLNEWIKSIFRIAEFQSGSKATIYIAFPVKANIRYIDIKNNIVAYNITAQKNISNLQINVYNKFLYRGYSRSSEFRPKLLKSPKKDKEDFYLYTGTIEFSNIPPSNHIEIQLINRNVPKLLIDILRCDPPLDNTLEPLIKSFREFFSIKEFTDQLFNPEKMKKKNITHDSSWYFEEAISWLLSMGGLSVIRLGEKEKISLISGVELSADILAYQENEFLFIIDCDIQHADPLKADKLLQITEIMKPMQNASGKPEIYPVLFTPKEPITAEIKKNIGIIDGPLIEELLKKAIEGDKKGFCEIIKRAHYRTMYDYK